MIAGILDILSREECSPTPARSKSSPAAQTWHFHTHLCFLKPTSEDIKITTSTIIMKGVIMRLKYSVLTNHHNWAVTHRINCLMLGKAHWCNTIDAYSQDSDEQMDNGDPVCKKRSRGNRKYVFQRTAALIIHHCHPLRKAERECAH